jgi:predicted alpha/beta-hydrolase family hydrolase
VLPPDDPQAHAFSTPEPAARPQAFALRAAPRVAAPSSARSPGSRVACRTADQVGAVAVLCLAFPVHPPGRPEKSRPAELDAVTVPTLVVKGERDPFGMPPLGPNRTVVTIPGTHS